MPDQPISLEVADASSSKPNRFLALQHELEARSRQQTAVAELGQAALTGVDASLLTGQACALVADTLDADFVRMLEYVPAEGHLVVRGSIGYSGPFEATEVDSEAIYTFMSNTPVDFEDLSTEVRFAPAAVLGRIGIVSGMSVPLTGPDGPFGVLGAYSKKPRRFRTFEIEFLQCVANVLSAAIAHRRAMEDLERGRAAIDEGAKLPGIGKWSWSRISLASGSLLVVVDRMLEGAQRAIEAKQLRLTADLHRGVTNIRGNWARLQRLTSDIMAMFVERAMPNDSLSVTVEPMQWEGHTSIGLAIELSREIFTPGELQWVLQPDRPVADDTTWERLSMAHRIASEHGAVLTFANRPSDGSSIAVLRFPPASSL